MAMEGEVSGLITPIQFAALIAPDKPPQYAYQLLKQGLPHIEVFKPGTNKTRPMVDPTVAMRWYEDSIATKAPRKTREGTQNGQINGDSIKKPVTPSGYQKGQLLTYQRKPGLCTVAEIMTSDNTLVYYSTVHADAIHTLDTKYTYPFTPEHLREKILGRKILLDTPRRVLQYVIDSLHILPCQDDDPALHDELVLLLQKYPQQVRVILPTKAEEDELEQLPDSAPVEDDEEERTDEECQE